MTNTHDYSGDNQAALDWLDREEKGCDLKSHKEERGFIFNLIREALTAQRPADVEALKKPLVMGSLNCRSEFSPDFVHGWTDCIDHLASRSLIGNVQPYCRSQQNGLPEGWQLVPFEPTKEMIEAMAAEYDPTWCYPDKTISNIWADLSYKAMLCAAPQPAGDGNE